MQPHRRADKFCSCNGNCNKSNLGSSAITPSVVYKMQGNYFEVSSLFLQKPFINVMHNFLGEINMMQNNTYKGCR